MYSVTLFGKIGSRLLRWFLLVALIPLILMGYQGYYFAKRAVQREVFLHLEAVARQKMMRIEQWFAERTTDIKVLSTNPAIVRDVASEVRGKTQQFPADLVNLLDHYRTQSESYLRLEVFDPKGILIAHSTVGEHSMVGSDLSDVVGNALQSNGVAASPVLRLAGIGTGMRLGCAIRDSVGNAVGVVTVFLSLSNTLDPIILDTTGLGRTGQAYLVDTSMVMLTPSRFLGHPEPLTHTMDSEATRRAITGSSGSGVYRGYGGQQVIGAWVYLPMQKWALIAEMDAEDAFAPLAMIRRNSIIMAILVLAIILAVVVMISRSISYPIRQLANASLQVSKGDLSASVEARSKDELGYLAEQFNSMVRSMKESQGSLKSAYEKLLHTQKLLAQSEKLAAVGQLVASIVHEIRNPLSSIKMNLSILETKCNKEGAISEHFQIAKSQTERLESMLTDLLNYSKPISVELQPIAVKDLVDSALQDVQTDSEIVVDLQDPVAVIQVDFEKMQQVLLNVLLNATQALPSHGSIEIRSRTVDFEGIQSLQLSIHDNGPGISKETLDQVFEPFFTTRKQGTGLGLPNAKRIIEAHGGDIEIRSEIGKGTEVIIMLTQGV